mmetsp:Transcript_29110/g.40513  ORF Transcript_29110/g.40513 Transcript_29110/m.40513 type:complete len:290 (+) Transcript_29110:2-871(+)
MTSSMRMRYSNAHYDSRPDAIASCAKTITLKNDEPNLTSVEAPLPGHSHKKNLKFLGAFSSPSHATMPNGAQIAVEGLRLMSEMRTFQRIFDSENMLMLPAASFDDLRSALMKVAPAVIHLSGHCCDEKWVFEGESRAVNCVSGQDLGAMFSTVRGLKCVVLSGCRSHKMAKAIKTLVPNLRVLCSETKLNNTFATSFCGRFYEELSEQKEFDVEKCFAKARFGIRSACDLKFGDPSKQLHEISKDGMPVLDIDHKGQPHPVDERSGLPVYSKHCKRCNPDLGGTFTLL